MEAFESIKEALSNPDCDVSQAPKGNEYTEPMDKQRFLNKLELNASSQEIAKELQGLSMPDRIEWIRKVKSLANEKYKLKEYDAAIKIYLKAMMGLDFRGTP